MDPTLYDTEVRGFSAWTDDRFERELQALFATPGFRVVEAKRPALERVEEVVGNVVKVRFR